MAAILFWPKYIYWDVLNMYVRANECTGRKIIHKEGLPPGITEPIMEIIATSPDTILKHS